MMKYNFDMNYPDMKIQTESDYKKTFFIDPLEHGFGTTVGNALRRIALSSLPGGAVKQISIKGVKHEFDVLPIIKEDITSIVLAIKDLKLRIDNQDEDYTLTLEANKKGILTGADIICPAGVEVINKDLEIATLIEDELFYMELVADKGIGYVLSEENRKNEKKSGIIYVDSIYTPVVNFAYHVEDTRVGDKTNYDKLIVTIETNGTITPEEAISYSAHIMKEHMVRIESLEDLIEESEVFNKNKEVSEIIEEKEKLETSIETLDISNRAYNALKRAEIDTIEQLCNKTKKDISGLENIGSKTVLEIEKQLKELGYEFKI